VNGYPMKVDQQDIFEKVMTLEDNEIAFWKKIKRDPFFLYLEDSIKHVDPYWVDLNRKLVGYEVTP